MSGPYLPGWALHRRTPRGWELETVELVPAGTNPDLLTDLPGNLSPAAVAVLIRSWTDQHQSPHDMAIAIARGQLPAPTVKTKVWHAWHTRDGQLDGRMPGEWNDLDDAAHEIAQAAINATHT